MKMLIAYYFGCIILWWLFTLIEGGREAWHFHLKVRTGKGAFPSDLNEHGLFTLQRTIVGIMVVVPFFLLAGPSWIMVAHSIAFGFCLMLMFPWLHDGSYYQVRHELDNSAYPKGWFDQSTTSTAMLTKVFTPKVRALAFMAGLVGAIVNLLFI